MKYNLGFFFRLLTILFFTSTYYYSQTTYFISSSEGNDSNNGTSISSPWKSLDKLHSSWNLIGAGDSILLKRGNTWTVTSKPSNRNGLIEVPNGKAGTPNNYIVIGAYGTGNKPVIDGTAINVYHQTIRTGGLSYFIFQDLDIRTTRGQLQFRAVDHFGGIHHIKFLSVDFTGTTIAQPDANIDFYNPPVGGYQNPSPNTYRPLHTIEIGYCTFSYTGGEDAIGLDNATNADHSGTNIWIHHNEFYSVSEEMFDIGGGNNHLIEYNFGSGIGTNGIKIHSQAMECNYGIIRGNVILHVGMGDAGTGTFPDNPTMANGNAFALWNLKGWKIYNNTVNSRWAFALGNSKVGSQIPFGRLEDNEIYNNTFYGSVQIIYYNLSTIGEPTIPLARDGNVFHHNTYYAPLESPKIRFWGSTSNVIDAETVTSANFTSAWSERFGYSNEVYEDFLPVNPTWTSFYNYGDMSLQESSPAVNDGVNSDGYSLDILGNIVPQDGITDRGAYEFNGVDITSPRVTSASLLNATTLLISFSEPLNIATAQNTNNYNISNGVTVSNAAISSYQVTLTTSVHPSGNFTVTVNNVQDMAGNIISSNNTASYTFNQDNEGPELVSAQINNATTVIVNFSEAINEADAETINNYIINNGISVTEAVLSDASKVTLTTSEHSNGTYNLVVSNVKDLANNVIASNNTAAYVYDVDTDQPALTSVEALSPNSIKVIFSEKVQKSSAENKSNYSIDNGISIVSAVLSSSEKEVILSTSEHAGGSYTLTANNILDLAGNSIEVNSTIQYNVEGDTVPPEVSSATLVDNSTIEVYFSEAVNQNDAETPGNYSINNGITVNSVLLSNSTKATLTTSAHSVGSYLVTVENVKDMAGNFIDSNNTAVYSIEPETGTPILLYAFASANNMVEVAFSKEVTQASAENTNNYTISDEINVLTASIKSSGTEVTLIVDELTPEFEYTLLVSNVEDLVGNSINADSNSTLFCYMNSDGPIALYDFTQGPNNNLVYDISCNGAPLNLTISNPTAITWLEGGGMSVNSSVIISSDIASKLNNNCKQTNALTIEAWIKPANTSQGGPARIVSLSNDPFNRNFTLGQGEGTNNTYGFDFRLRTTATDNNGFPSVTANSPALTTNLTHVVYTRTSEGETNIYIDGVKTLSTNLGGNLSNWDNSFKLILANEMTGDRPWIGEYYKIAIYDQALEAVDVQSIYESYLSTILVDIKVFLEGPYNNGVMTTNLKSQNVIPFEQPYTKRPWKYNGGEKLTNLPNDMVDWVLVELRSDENHLVSQRAAILRSDGSVVDLNGISNVAFPDIPEGDYYIIINHRNHLAVMSSHKVHISKNTSKFDMTLAENIYHSDGATNLELNIFGMYAGDTNTSAIITYADANNIIRKNTNLGYLSADNNLTGIVTYSDVESITKNNTKSTKVPKIKN